MDTLHLRISGHRLKRKIPTTLMYHDPQNQVSPLLRDLTFRYLQQGRQVLQAWPRRHIIKVITPPHRMAHRCINQCNNSPRLLWLKGTVTMDLSVLSLTFSKTQME
jgi:hypothetical protein